MENKSRSTFGDVASTIEDELSQLAIGLVKRKPKEEKVPSRVNLYVVGFAAFALLTLLDIISGIATALLTQWFYGVLVVVIGVGALSVAEVGFFWAYSSRWQKIISIVDGVIGISATLLIGIVSGALFGADKFGILKTGGITAFVEIGMIVSLGVIGVTHAILWISYVLIDKGVQMYQNYNQGKAQNKMRNETLQLSEENMLNTIAMAGRLLAHSRQNKGGLLREEIKNLTGEDLLEGFGDSPKAQADK